MDKFYKEPVEKSERIDKLKEALFAQMPQDGKIVGRCWILAQRPNAAERVAADVIAGFKFHDAGRNHVEEGFQRFCFRVGLLFSSENTHPVASMNR